jgi:hypothetical protein
LGDEVFNGQVGTKASPLASLTTDDQSAPTTERTGGHAIFNAPGTTADPSVITTGAQIYNDNVELGSDTVLATAGTTGITFVNGVLANSHSLTLVFNDVPFAPSFQADVDARRILSSISPRVKKGQAKAAEGSSGKAVEIPSLVPVERSYGEHFDNQQ